MSSSALSYVDVRERREARGEEQEAGSRNINGRLTFRNKAGKKEKINLATSGKEV